MKLFDVLENDLKYVETLAETKLLPWAEALLKQVEHDFVTAVLPIIETSGAQVAADIVSGQPIAAIEAVVIAVVKQAAQNMAKVGVETTTHDFAAAIAAYFASLSATGGKTTAAQAQ